MKSNHGITKTLPSLLVVIFLCTFGFAFSVLGEDVSQPKPGPKHKALEVWLGEWDYEGKGSATPFGPAGKFHGKESHQMIMGGFFLENKWRDKSENGYVAEGLTIMGYDSPKQSYTENNFDNDGVASLAVCTVEGNVWTTTGNRADVNGKNYKIRVVRTLSEDGKSYKSKAEYSADDGKTWKPWWELTARRTKV